MRKRYSSGRYVENGRRETTEWTDCGSHNKPSSTSLIMALLKLRRGVIDV